MAVVVVRNCDKFWRIILPMSSLLSQQQSLSPSVLVLLFIHHFYPQFCRIWVTSSRALIGTWGVWMAVIIFVACFHYCTVKPGCFLYVLSLILQSILLETAGSVLSHKHYSLCPMTCISCSVIRIQITSL